MVGVINELKSKLYLTPGTKCHCFGPWPWKYPFIGIIEKVYTNSVLVRIVSTTLEDDHIVWEKMGRTVISKKKIKIAQ